MPGETAEGRSVDIRNTGEYIKLRTNYTRLKMEHATLQTELEQVKSERDSANAAVEDAKTKYDNNKLKTENEELRGKLRTTEHRKVFDRLAKARGVADDALDDLWTLSGYQAAKEDVDEAAIGTLLDEQKTKPGRARLFGDVQPETPASTPGPARGQGNRDMSGGKFRATVAQQSDNEWLRANYEKREQAIRDGTFELID